MSWYVGCEIYGLVDRHLDSISSSDSSISSSSSSSSGSGSGSKSIINGEKSRVPPVQV